MPRRSTLQQLADAIGEPDLMTAIPSIAHRIGITCTNCGSISLYEAGDLRAAMKRGEYRHVDPACFTTGEGRGLCGECAHEAGGKKAAGTLVKRYGRGTTRRGSEHAGGVLARTNNARSLYAAGQRVRASRTPEVAKRALANAHEANRGRVRGADERERHAVGGTRPRLRGRYVLCEACHDLLYLPPGLANSLSRHVECEGREPVKRFGRKFPLENIMIARYVTVTHALRQPHDSRYRRIDELAEELDIPERTVAWYVEWFRDHLPTDRGDDAHRTLALWLREVRDGTLFSRLDAARRQRRRAARATRTWSKTTRGS